MKTKFKAKNCIGTNEELGIKSGMAFDRKSMIERLFTELQDFLRKCPQFFYFSTNRVLFTRIFQI